MKSKIANIDLIIEYYNHLSIALFRSIEIQAIHLATSGLTFKNPAIDVGAGDGFLCAQIFDEQFSTAIDNNEAEDSVLGLKSNSYLNYIVGDAADINVKSDSHNFAFSNCVLEHIPNIYAVLDEINRILSNGAYFVFTVPNSQYGDYFFLTQVFNRFGMFKLASWYRKARNKMLNHYNCWDTESWERELASRGFRLINKVNYINDRTLYLWDKIAIIFAVFRFFPFDISGLIRKKYLPIVKNQIKCETFLDGSCTVYVFQKFV